MRQNKKSPRKKIRGDFSTKKTQRLGVLVTLSGLLLIKVSQLLDFEEDFLVLGILTVFVSSSFPITFNERWK